MFSTNNYLETTDYLQMPKLTINNVQVNFDAGTEKVVRTADLGRSPIGDRIDETPSVITKLRYGLNRVQLSAPNPAVISDAHYNIGYFAVVPNQSKSLIEGKIFDKVGSSGSVPSRAPVNLLPQHIIPAVGSNGAKHATWPFDEVKHPLSSQIYTPDTVCDFNARIFNNTGITFGGGYGNNSKAYGYAFYLSGATMKIVYVDSTSAGLAVTTELASVAVTQADYDDKDVSYRLRDQFVTNSAIGQLISLYRIVAGVPSLVVEWNSENLAGKKVISMTGWSFGGLWDYAGGSSGEIIQINGGTVYSKIP